MRTPTRFIRKAPKAEHLLNDEIRAPQVRLIGDEGEPVGVVATPQAILMAQERGLDLVEVATQADPPVCRIMDYKKFLYEKNRKKKEARKQQRQIETKEVKLRPGIDGHDYQTKLQHLRKFILKGNKVKISLMFRRREMRRYEIGIEVVDRMIKDVADVAEVDPGSRSQGRIISVMVSPKREVMAEAERQFKEELKQRKREHERRLAEKRGVKADEETDSADDVVNEEDDVFDDDVDEDIEEEDDEDEDDEEDDDEESR